MDEKMVEQANKMDDGEGIVKSAIQKEILCTGETFTGPEKDAEMKCIFAHNGSPWLRLGPMKLEIKSKEPYIAVIRELMYPHECDNITSFLGPYLNFPPGRMGGPRVGKNDWTMKK